MNAYESIILEVEQTELLMELVELARTLPREKRQKFMVAGTDNGDFLIYPGYKNREIYMPDVEILSEAGLVSLGYSGTTPNFFVRPEGFGYYEFLKTKSGQPVQRIQESIKHYFNQTSFQESHGISFGKWLTAEELLWKADSEQELTTIGHKCREALQEFATELVNIHRPVGVNPDVTKVVTRIRAVLDMQGGRLGKSKGAFLEALIAYWGTVSDLVQRQEHGGQKEGEPLVWEDGRRVVFQTAVVMYEIHRTLS
jgi:hypothetical protein